MCLLGDINGWIGDRTIAGIADAFGVLKENENVRRVVGVCAEREHFVSNTYFKHRSLYKYTRVAMGQDGVDFKRMIGLVLVKRDMLRYVQD